MIVMLSQGYSQVHLQRLAILSNFARMYREAMYIAG